MTENFPGKNIALATHNPGKAAEFSRLFAPLGVRIQSAAKLNLPEPEETGSSFEENALIKARSACTACGLPSLADDSGLAVTALAGEPGIYSARWAGPEKDFKAAMSRVHSALGSCDDRSAAFVAVLAVVWPDGKEAVFEGRCAGTLLWPPRGDSGFGYDPIFQPDGENLTFGQMDAGQKAQYSHRAAAFNALKEALF